MYVDKQISTVCEIFLHCGILYINFAGAFMYFGIGENETILSPHVQEGLSHDNIVTTFGFN